MTSHLFIRAWRRYKSRVSPRPHRDWLTALLAALAVAVFFGDLLAGGQVLYYRDLASFHLPFQELLAACLDAHELPLWNPDIGLGMPLTGDASAMPWYLPRWITVLLFSSVRGLSLLVVAHFMWAAAGATLLALRFQPSKNAALIAGLSYGLGGYLLSQHFNLLYLVGGAWLPWVLWSFDRLRRHGRARDLAGGSLALSAMVYGGDLQLALTMPPLLLLMALLLGSSAPADPLRGRGHAAKQALILVVSAYALAALQILPGIDLLLESRRAQGLPLDEIVQWSLAPNRLLELLVPYLHGSNLPWPMGLDESQMRWVASPYIGALVLGLAVVGLLHQGWRPMRWVAVVTLLFGLAALGAHTPLYLGLLKLAPVLGVFRYPAKFAVVSSLMLSLAAAQGLSTILDDNRRREAFIVVALPALGAGLALWLVPAQGAARQIPSASYPVALHLALLALLATLLVALFRRERLRPEFFASLMALLVFFDLGVLGWPLRPAAEASLLEQAPPTLNRAQKLRRSEIPPRLLYAPELDDVTLQKAPSTDSPSARTFWFTRTALDRLRLHPNLGVGQGLQILDGFSPLAPSGLHLPALPTARRRALDLLDVSLWVAPLASPTPTHQALLARYPRQAFELRRRLGAQGRCRLIDPSAANPLWAAEPQQLFAAELPSAGGSCRITAYRHNSLALTTDAAQASVLLLAERWHPGWRAEVDGRPTPVRALGSLLRAVELAPGRHQLRLHFVSMTTLAGAGLSGATAFFLLGLALYRRRRG